MTAIVEFLKYIIDTLSSCVDFIVNYFSQVFKFWSAIPEVVNIISSCIAWLPDYVIPFAMWFLAIAGIMIIIRR